MEIIFKSSDLNNVEDLKILKDDTKRDVYVSIVVPCYNVRDYIDRCLESLVYQTIGIEHLQIIVVDDVSTDGTMEKLLEWKERFPKEIVVVSYKENLRQGGARNVGIQCADAEYIGFVDSDDWVEFDMYERLFEKTRDKKYDIVKGKFMRESFIGKNGVVNNNQRDVYYEFENRNGWYVGDTPDVGNNGEFGSVNTAIYRKDIIFDNNVWFPEHMAYEDNYWGAILSLYTRDMYIVDRIIYHYFINVNSTIMTKNSAHHLDRLNAEVLKVEEFKKRGAFEALYEELEGEFIELFYANTIHTIFTKFDSMEIMPKVYRFMKDRIYDYFPNFMKNPRIKKFGPVKQKMISILEIPGYLDEEDFEKIRTAYLEVLGYVK